MNDLPKSIVVFGQTVKLRKMYDERVGTVHGATVAISKSRWSERFGAKIHLKGQWVSMAFRSTLDDAIANAEKTFLKRLPKTVASLATQTKEAKAVLRKVSR